MKHFLDYVLRRLASFPEDVDVCEVPGDEGVTFRVCLNPEDIGRVIGRNGRTIGAIRGLLNATASRHDQHVVVEIMETGTEPAR